MAGHPVSTKPGSVCLDCPRLAVSRGRCAVHQRAQRQAFDATRPSASERLGPDWPKYRDAAKLAQPYCSVCGSTEWLNVHHEPRYVQGTPHDRYQLIVLCQSHHSAITRVQVGR